MPLIRYVGKKAGKFDNVAGSGTLWSCQGEDKMVTDAVAARLLMHPDTWALTEAVEIEQQPEQEHPPEATEVRFAHVDSDNANLYQLRDLESDEVIDLTQMDDNAMKAFIGTNGLRVDRRKKGDELRSLIIATVIHMADAKG